MQYLHTPVMHLSRYLSERGVSGTAFAKQAGVAQSTIWRLVSQGVIPQRQTIDKIVAAADGRVSEADLVAEALAIRRGRAAA
jgi:predicted transcriptional regulator